MSERAEIRSRLETALNENFLDVDGWDSLSHVRLILAVEREFSLEVPPDDAARLNTFGAVVDYIERRSPA